MDVMFVGTATVFWSARTSACDCVESRRVSAGSKTFRCRR